MNIQFISAGAGSGKTHKLMELVSAEIASGVSPERILATTFTVKAAEEIRSRVRKWFLDKNDFETAGKAGAVHIGTVNSVCGRLVSDFAFEAGLSPDLKVCEAIEASAILSRVIGRDIDPSVIDEFNQLERKFGIDALFSSRKSAGKPKRKNGESKWKAQLEEIIKLSRSYNINPSEFSIMAEHNADDMLAGIGAELVDCDERVTSIIEDALSVMDTEQREKNIGTTDTYIELCREFLAALRSGKDSWNMWVKLEKTRPGKTHKKSTMAADGIAMEVAAWRTHPRFHREVRRYITLLFTTAANTMILYAEEKDRTGKIDFTDQEVKLYELLEREDIRSRLAERVEIVFVDEFQDTSPMQLALFLSLAGIAKKTYWIGDVKQAIYGFRGSDSSLMKRILSGLGQDSAPSIPLEFSWRSRPALVKLCNDIFSKAFSGELTPDEITLKAKREEIDSPYFARWNLESNVDEQLSAIVVGMQKLIDSGMKVVDQDSKKERPVAWNDIAVLSFFNVTCDSLRSACRKAGIPLRSSGTGLLSTPEACLAVACLRRLNDREDTLASAEILGLSSGISPEVWLADRIKLAESKDYEANALWKCTGSGANPVLVELEKMRPLARELSPSSLLDTVIVHCHLEDFLIGWTNSVDRARERLQNLEALRSLVARYEEESRGKAVSLAGLLLWLEDQGKARVDELPPSVIDGITISTWHGAKGLEWPVVILHQSAKEIKSRIWGSVKAVGTGEFDIHKPLAGTLLRFWPWPWGAQEDIPGLDTSGNSVCAHIEEQAVSEEKRLLYVGCTRARDFLVITQSVKAVKNPGYACLGPEATEMFLGAPIVETLCPEENATMLSGTESTGEQEITPAIHWFSHDVQPAVFPLAAIIPSESDGHNGTSSPEIRILRKEHYGNAIPAISKEMIREEGTRFHTAFAFYANNPEYGGMSEFPAEWRNSVGFCLNALERLFPESCLHTELPVLVDAGNGQYIDARLDLVVETAEGFHIIDHKLSESASDDLQAIAARYATQLSLYRKAFELKSGKPVLGVWLNVPMVGLLAEVGGV